MKPKFFIIQKVTLRTILIILFFVAALNASEQTDGMQIVIRNWLKAGPVEVKQPVFHEAENPDSYLENLLDFSHFNVNSIWPEENQLFARIKGVDILWINYGPEKDSVRLAAQPRENAVFYLATYLEADEWLKGNLQISGSAFIRAHLNGKKIGDLKPDGKFEKEISLEKGKHLLLLKVIRGPQSGAFAVKFANSDTAKILKHGISPNHSMNLRHLLNDPVVSGLSLSPDGAIAALTVEKINLASEKKESWIELHDVAKSQLLRTFRGGTKISSLKWAGGSNAFSYLTEEDNRTTLWLENLERGTTKPILENVENFSGYSWSAAGDYIIYSITEKNETIHHDIKKVESPRDRWPGYRNRDYLYLLDVESGFRTRLTEGSLTTDLESISRDGSKFLFSRTAEDYSHRPYSKTTVYSYDLQNFSADSLLSSYWLSGVSWSPDGKKILLLGGPSAFGEPGRNVSGGKIPNEGDTQAYLCDVDNGKITPLSKDFNPGIQSAHWLSDDLIYFVSNDRDYRNLYRLNLKDGIFKKMETGSEVIDQISFSRTGEVALYSGSGAAVPDKVYKLDLKENSAQVFYHHAMKETRTLQLEPVKYWSFQNERGTTIDGRVYYPPGFDASKQYPCIVYYYGGTSAVTRDFGGRYPKNYWAANGYVVYILQPSGAIGYGQDFSALHVNDWGEIVADEIILGVKKFLAAHLFVDPKRVGAIGASYGGFMTMQLLTKTDMFSAAVSHAGISSISSYWGEGFWGFLYSARASAHSFPWNRRDIYVERSALFSADKINTPLLLTHGSADTNVPPGESIQLFTALKLLRKPVEYLEVQGENHWVMTYEKRKHWTKSIVAWFDKWLKGQSGWWDSLYSDN